jgi:hypothetical protein
MINEKQDACYHKVKSRYKVWPSAYASGALVQCRKKGASNWGTGGKKDESSIMKGIVDEAGSAAQQAAIAISKKERGEKPKNEGVIIGHDKDDPQVAVLGGAGSYKLSNLKKKALGEAKQLAADIASGEYKNSAYNVKQLANTLNTIVAAEEEMEKLYFGEDYTGEFAAEKTPAINPYGGLKDRQHRGAIGEALLSEMPTDNPTGASGEGGWRKYKPKPAGLEEGDVVPFKQNVEANHDEMNYSKDPKNRYYVIDHTMNKLVLTTNDEEEAKREAAEWAEYDDLETSVVDSTTGKRVIYFDGYGDAAEYLEDSDDDWIPDVEEFEQEEEIRNRKAKPANDIDEDTAYAGGMGQGGNAGQSYRKFKPKSAGTFKEDEQLDELKCWSGYTRVKGVPAGAPGSCKKKTKESAIMKGLKR